MKPKALLAPSVLGTNLSRLKEDLLDIQQKGIQVIHWDVMDGHFVNNLTFGPKMIQDYRPLFPNLIFDVHLMISNPHEHLDPYIKAGADWITFHLESLPRKEIKDALHYIRTHNRKTGISIKPYTSVEELYPYLSLLDLVLIMSVEPGFGGQDLMVDCLQKIKILSEEQKNLNFPIMISVDGGIKEEHLEEIHRLGADIIVMGSGFFAHPHQEALIHHVASLNRR